MRPENVEFTVKVCSSKGRKTLTHSCYNTDGRALSGVVALYAGAQAAEDLILTGKERSIVRVPANNMYSCLMQKTQRFSSLFRHYSKHHGLPRESLDFFFTVRRSCVKALMVCPYLLNACLSHAVGVCVQNRLDPEDSPESVHLQKVWWRVSLPWNDVVSLLIEVADEH